MVMNGGTQITRVKTIRQLLNDTDIVNNGKKFHYFYIIKVPRCGASRIKIGKSADIIGRMKYYQSYFHGSLVQLLELRRFSNTVKYRFQGNAMKLYDVYEAEAKKALRKFNPEQTANEEGKITEWFKGTLEKELMKAYKEFTETFIKLDIPRTEKKASMPRAVKKDVDYKEKEEKDIFKEEPKTNKRVSKPVQNFKPNK
jgi:hypothetical protein